MRHHRLIVGLVVGVGALVPFRVALAEGGGGWSPECKQKMELLKQEMMAKKQALQAEHQQKVAALHREMEQRKAAIMAQCKGAGHGQYPGGKPGWSGQNPQGQYPGGGFGHGAAGKDKSWKQK